MQINSTSEIIDLLGGNSAVGTMTATRPKTVSMWRTFGKFPYRTQMVLTEALRTRGVEAAPSLWGMSKEQAA